MGGASTPYVQKDHHHHQNVASEHCAHSHPSKSSYLDGASSRCAASLSTCEKSATPPAGRPHAPLSRDCTRPRCAATRTYWHRFLCPHPVAHQMHALPSEPPMEATRASRSCVVRLHASCTLERATTCLAQVRRRRWHSDFSRRCAASGRQARQHNAQVQLHVAAPTGSAGHRRDSKTDGRCSGRVHTTSLAGEGPQHVRHRPRSIPPAILIAIRVIAPSLHYAASASS